MTATTAPTRPTRPLQKGDVVEWTKADGTRREGMFHHEDSVGRGYVSLIDEDGEVYVPMSELHYVDVASIKIPPNMVEKIVSVLDDAAKDGYIAVAHSALRARVYSASDITFQKVLVHLVESGRIERSEEVLKDERTYKIPNEA